MLKRELSKERQYNHQLIPLSRALKTILRWCYSIPEVIFIQRAHICYQYLINLILSLSVISVPFGTINLFAVSPRHFQLSENGSLVIRSIFRSKEFTLHKAMLKSDASPISQCPFHSPCF